MLIRSVMICSDTMFSDSYLIFHNSDAGISAVAFHPGKDMAVSSSFGCNFKVGMPYQLCG